MLLTIKKHLFFVIILSLLWGGEISVLRENHQAWGFFYFVVQKDDHPLRFDSLIQHLQDHTSIEISPKPYHYHPLHQTLQRFPHPWLFTHSLSSFFSSSPPHRAHHLLRWLLRGGTLYAESSLPLDTLQKHSAAIATAPFNGGTWRTIPADHEVMKSFYLLEALPSCPQHSWKEFRYHDRTMILLAPPGFLHSVADTPAVQKPCFSQNQSRQHLKVMVNIIMIFLTLDYKNDIIHLPEILKRLR